MPNQQFLRPFLKELLPDGKRSGPTLPPEPIPCTFFSHFSKVLEPLLRAFFLFLLAAEGLCPC